MPLRRLSIQWKITLLAGLCLLAIVALLVATSLTQARRSACACKRTPRPRHCASSAISWTLTSMAMACAAWYRY